MKGKIIVLVLMLILITGCDATYNLEYTNGTFKENLSINNLSGHEDVVRNYYSVDISTDYKDIIDYTKDEGLSYGYTYYEKSLIESNGLVLNYSYEFDKDSYDNTMIGRNVFPELEYYNHSITSGSISDIYTRYPDLNNITIEFKTDMNVGYNNADTVVDDTYYWYINKENSESKNIKIIMTEQENNNIINQIEEELNSVNITESDFDLSLIWISLGIILLIIGLFVFIKVKNSNKK